VLPTFDRRKDVLTQAASRKRDLASIVTAGRVVLGKWWRQGEVWQLKKSGYVRLDGCRIGLEDSYPPGFRNLLSTGIFERPEREAINRFLDPELPVIELGGCIGVVACTTNRRLRFPQQHVVVEANPAMIPFLKTNRDRNRSRFTILHGALGYESSGFVQMSFQDSNPLASSAQVAKGNVASIQAVTLGGILERYPFERFTLICDIEGSEFEMIEREREILDARVALIIIEIHERMLGPDSTRLLHANLKKANFEIIRRIGETYVLRRSLPWQ
jgi:FkbM family methyltransferase